MTAQELKERARNILIKFGGNEPYWQEENIDYSSINFQGEVLLMNKNNFNIQVQLTKLFEMYFENK